jgi:anti-sigma28 factor (negative regulator of flagellin synthesis)
MVTFLDTETNMAHISGGEVTYGRTMKTGDYENKRVDVKLTFGVDDGEDVEAILTKVSITAVRKAHEMLGIPAPAAATAAVASKSAATAKAGKEAAAAVTKVEKTQTPTPAAAETVVDEKKVAVEQAAISTGAERVDPAQVADELDEVAPITDAQLADAAKQKNATLKDPVRIKALRDKYAGKTPSILSEIPKDKRQAFLDELKKMQ